jgi:uncharacterized repeat protein (TIGR01451 family)
VAFLFCELLFGYKIKHYLCCNKHFLSKKILNTMNKIYTLLAFFCFYTQMICAQCDPVDNCNEISCLIGSVGLEDGQYTTVGFTSGAAPGFCGTVENEQWFAVTAQSNEVTVTATPTNCNTGNGIQVAFYQSCADLVPIACYGGVSGGAFTPATFTTDIAVPGQLYYIMIDGYAGDQCDFTITVEGIKEVADYKTIIGSVTRDINSDCVRNTGDLPVEGVKINLQTNNTVVKPTKADGTFYKNYLGFDSLIVSMNPIQGGFWAVCEDTMVVHPSALNDTSVVDFSLQPVGNDCPAVYVEMGVPSFIRSCTQFIVPIKYFNYGNINAENTKIQFIYPSNSDVSIDSISVTPYSINGDTILFDIGNVGPLEGGVLKLFVQAPCATFSFVSSVICFSSKVYSTNECPISIQPYANIVVRAGCLQDSFVRYIVENIGTGPMQQPSQYHLFQNGVNIENGTFLLQSGESFYFDYPIIDSSIMHFSAEQSSDYPGISNPAIDIVGCGFDFHYWNPNLYPNNDLEPQLDIECRQVVASCDPNLKTGFPIGFGPEHFIEANQPLEYVIDFQNTGTDTAFLVVLRDALPPQLDISSFKAGPSSHPYTWEITDNNMLEFRFSPIALPDTAHNYSASSGWVEFTINQVADLPIGTRIENFAAIYFDQNDPVITATDYHTIGKIILIDIDEPIVKTSSKWQILGNPTVDKAIFINPKASNSEHLFQLIDVQGKLVDTEVFFGSRFEFERKQLATGVYFFKIMDEKGGVSSGKIVVE